MIYKFKSKASGDVIMMKPNGDQVLRLIGKTPGPRGIVTVAELPAAIAALEAAIHREAELAAAGHDAQHAPAESDDDMRPEDFVGLHQRAWPLLTMMKESLAEHADIVWGV